MRAIDGVGRGRWGSRGFRSLTPALSQREREPFGANGKLSVDL
jgi:hypothetical protein